MLPNILSRSIDNGLLIINVTTTNIHNNIFNVPHITIPFLLKILYGINSPKSKINVTDNRRDIKSPTNASNRIGKTSIQAEFIISIEHNVKCLFFIKNLSF